ncbi:hypothetical protein Hanom_Chr11g01051881 [Helianthus anomalus]
MLVKTNVTPDKHYRGGMCVSLGNDIHDGLDCNLERRMMWIENPFCEGYMGVNKGSIHTQTLVRMCNRVFGEKDIQREIYLSWFLRACDLLGKAQFQRQSPKSVGECESGRKGLNQFQHVYADVRQYHSVHSCAGMNVGE